MLLHFWKNSKKSHTSIFKKVRYRNVLCPSDALCKTKLGHDKIKCRKFSQAQKIIRKRSRRTGTCIAQETHEDATPAAAVSKLVCFFHDGGKIKNKNITDSFWCKICFCLLTLTDLDQSQHHQPLLIMWHQLNRTLQTTEAPLCWTICAAATPKK